MAAPPQQPNESPKSTVNTTPTTSISTPPSKQETTAPKVECKCYHYHSQGLGCPCNAIYAIKVGRKATERILAKSKFFTDSKILVQSQSLEDFRNKSNEDNNNNNTNRKNIDDSAHSAVNHILQLGRKDVELGKVLGKGGFCIVYEAFLPSLIPQDPCTSTITSSNEENGIKGETTEKEPAISASPPASVAVSVPTDHATDHDEEDKNSENNHQHYCVKFLKPSVLSERKKFARGIADLAIEAHFLASLNHPHILKIRGVSQSFQLYKPSSPSYLSDLTHDAGLEGGCFLLLDQLAVTLDKKISGEWKEKQFHWNSFLNRTVHDIRGTKRKNFRLERITVALQLAQAMQYLHQHNICYRDLKPDNIGFDLHDSLKLFDFGLAKELKDYKRHVDGTYQLTANTGSKRYMAPEVATRERYNLSVDVFSYGILFWEICSLEKPFDGFTEVQHMSLVVQRGHRPRLDILKNWPISVKHIISRCWHPISGERPTFRQVVNALIQVQNEMSEGS